MTLAANHPNERVQNVLKWLLDVVAVVVVAVVHDLQQTNNCSNTIEDQRKAATCPTTSTSARVTLMPHSVCN